jgi:hypothetical protein
MKQLELEEKRISASSDKLKLLLADMEDQKAKGDAMTMADFAGYIVSRLDDLESKAPDVIQPVVYVDVISPES